jgi:hypothetical protein
VLGATLCRHQVAIAVHCGGGHTNVATHHTRRLSERRRQSRWWNHVLVSGKDDWRMFWWLVWQRWWSDGCAWWWHRPTHTSSTRRLHRRSVRLFTVDNICTARSTSRRPRRRSGRRRCVESWAWWGQFSATPLVPHVARPPPANQQRWRERAAGRVRVHPANQFRSTKSLTRPPIFPDQFSCFPDCGNRFLLTQGVGHLGQDGAAPSVSP